MGKIRAPCSKATHTHSLSLSLNINRDSILFDCKLFRILLLPLHSSPFERQRSSVSFTSLSAFSPLCIHSLTILPSFSLSHISRWYLYISIQTFVTLAVVSEAIHSIGPNVKARRERRKAAKEGFPDLPDHKCPHIDVVLVAYLPNEKGEFRCGFVRQDGFLVASQLTSGEKESQKSRVDSVIPA